MSTSLGKWMTDKFIPNFIVHYNRGEPFRSITSFPQDQWQSIIVENCHGGILPLVGPKDTELPLPFGRLKS